jgi:hypothetical protein
VLVAVPISGNLGGPNAPTAGRYSRASTTTTSEEAEHGLGD